MDDEYYLYSSKKESFVTNTILRIYFFIKNIASNKDIE
jgi:hypothetical protein